MSAKDEDRQDRFTKRDNVGRYGAARESWIGLSLAEFVLYIGGNRESEDGPPTGFDGTEFPQQVSPVKLFISKGRHNTSLNLTLLTEAEIDGLREFLNRALDIATEASRELDTLAQQAFEKGDDSYARLYRPLPRLVVREGVLPPHGEGVPSRPEGSAELSE